MYEKHTVKLSCRCIRSTNARQINIAMILFTRNTLTTQKQPGTHAHLTFILKKAA